MQPEEYDINIRQATGDTQLLIKRSGHSKPTFLSRQITYQDGQESMALALFKNIQVILDLGIFSKSLNRQLSLLMSIEAHRP